jgi:glucosamine kinase
MMRDVILLGVDGGGSRCRARLAATDGTILAESYGGPANLRLGVDESVRVVCGCVRECLRQASLAGQERSIVACLALAGASEPDKLAAARQVRYPFRSTLLTTDARAACIGAHGGTDGGIVIVGTGSIGWASVGGEEHRVGGWGFPLSDQGSGAWIGFAVLKRLLWAHDGLTEWTGLLRSLLDRFAGDPHAVVRWMDEAKPADYASLAPMVVSHAVGGDTVGLDVMLRAAGYIEAIAKRLDDLGVSRLCLMGGLADSIGPFLPRPRRNALSPPLGDALSGALRLAGLEAQRLAALNNKDGRA